MPRVDTSHPAGNHQWAWITSGRQRSAAWHGERVEEELPGALAAIPDALEPRGAVAEPAHRQLAGLLGFGGAGDVGGEHVHVVSDIARGLGEAAHVAARGIPGEPREVVRDHEETHRG